MAQTGSDILILDRKITLTEVREFTFELIGSGEEE